MKNFSVNSCRCASCGAGLNVSKSGWVKCEYCANSMYIEAGKESPEILYSSSCWLSNNITNLTNLSHFVTKI